MKASAHSALAIQLAKKITVIIELIDMLRPFLETVAAHPEHNPIDDEDGKPLPFSEAAGALLKEIDEYLEWERELEDELESKPQ